MKTGDPRKTSIIVGNPVRRFWSKVEVVGDCWEWQGTKQAEYGLFREDGKNVLAYRWSYAFFGGVVPEGLQLDHLCRNRSCVNPAHLEPVTPRDNTLRGTGPAAKNAQKTHCKWGHPLSGDNLYVIIRKGTPNPRRACKTCIQKRSDETYRKKVKSDADF